MRSGTRSAATLALALAAAALCGCASGGGDVDGQRRKDEEFLATKAGDLFEKKPRSWAVVQGGEAVASGPTADDAVRLAAGRPATSGGASSPVVHRFVFRKDDPGARLHRLAYMPDGGLVAGRQFLSDLGFRVVSSGSSGRGRPLVLEHRGARRTIDLAERPRLRIEVGPLAGATDTAAAPLDVPLDPDFDGPLLLPDAATPDLALDLAEIPGRAEVQVALGRPFAARRAWVAVTCPDLGVGGVVEVLVPLRGPTR
jgi:hypothetical protein